MKTEIELLEKKLDWISLSNKYSPSEIATNLGYEKGMRLANKMVSSDYKNDELIRYSINVIISIKNLYSSEWEKDWKNAAFLGILWTIIWEYEESYKTLLESYQKSEDPPATLIFELANCYFYPPEYHVISEENAEQLLKKSLNKKVTYEAAIRLKDIYESRQEIELSKYYEQMAKLAEEKNLHIEDMSPDVIASD
jgi:hypothetical protein